MKKSRISIFRATILGLSAIVLLMLSLPRSDGRLPEKREHSAGAKILTVEQAGNKNIKVMKGMPNAQLIPSMRLISAALGVRCEFCHVSKNGQLDAAAEDKKEKETARDMIRMVREINRANFKGEARVSCFTCHMGQPRPQKFPALPVATVSPESANQPAESSPPRLPSGAAIIDNYIAAIGGQAAIARIKTCQMKGKFANAAGATGSYEIEQIAPDKGYESIMTSRGGRERIVNKTAGWEKTSFGTSDLLPEQVPDTQLSFPLLLDIQLKRQYSEAEVSGKEKVNDREVYLVDATRKDRKREHLYFDVENGLLLRRISYTVTMIGIIPEQIDFGDYREIEGVKFPFSVRVSNADSNNPGSMRTFEEVKLNIPVDDAKFAQPVAK